MKCKKCGATMKTRKRARITELPKNDGKKEEQFSGPKYDRLTTAQYEYCPDCNK